jgi:hypothetical protein
MFTLARGLGLSSFHRDWLSAFRDETGADWAATEPTART